MKKKTNENDKSIYETLNTRVMHLTSKFGIQNIDEVSLIEKIIKKIDDYELEQLFKESISIVDRLESLKKLLVNKKLGDLTEDDSKLIEETLFLKPIRKVKTEKGISQSKAEQNLLFKD